jgi:hypothetical protein
MTGGSRLSSPGRRDVLKTDRSALSTLAALGVAYDAFSVAA